MTKKPKPTVPEVLPMVQEIYKKSINGCCLHIALADQNIQNQSIEFCIEQASEKGHDDCKKLGETMLQMSRTQRLKLANSNEKFKLADMGVRRIF